jgi:hypothetical protein
MFRSSSWVVMMTEGVSLDAGLDEDLVVGRAAGDHLLRCRS